MSVTAADSPGGTGNESPLTTTATTSLGAGDVSIAHEAAPVVSVQAISQGGLVEGGFSAGQGLFSYTVSADTDGSTQTLSVSDSVAGTHTAYFALSDGQVVLTTAGAAYFNSHDASDLQSLQVSVTAADSQTGGGNESQGSATSSLAAGHVAIAAATVPPTTANAVPSAASAPLNGSGVGPVALDLTGSGIQYVGLNAGIEYSYSATAPAVDTAWVAPQDGVLAYKGADGSIQVAFSTAPGQTDLQGLAQVYDSNHDGVLNSSDPSFANFGVVQIAGAGATPTFTSLSTLGVADISLVSNGQTSTAANGNVTVYGQTTYQLSDGATLAAADVSFATTPVSATQPAGTATSATTLPGDPVSPVASVTPAVDSVTNFAATSHPDSIAIAGSAASASAIETASLAAAGAAVAPAPVTPDTHTIVAAAQSPSDPSAAGSHVQVAAPGAMTIDLTGATYSVTPNLPASGPSVALDSLSLAADPGAHPETASGAGSSWVDMLSTPASQAGGVHVSQADTHAATIATDGAVHPVGWVAAVDSATTDSHTAAAPAATADANPLVNLPAIAPADLLLHDSTTVAPNPWHA